MNAAGEGAFYARKRWGRGRVRQLVALYACRARGGHVWGRPRSAISRCERCPARRVVVMPPMTLPPSIGLAVMQLSEGFRKAMVSVSQTAFRLNAAGFMLRMHQMEEGFEVREIEKFVVSIPAAGVPGGRRAIAVCQAEANAEEFARCRREEDGFPDVMVETTGEFSRRWANEIDRVTVAE